METGFEAMGKPIPNERRDAAYAAARSMGLDAGPAMEIVGRIADALERDHPYAALNVKGVDVTGRYRLVATLLT